MIGSFLRPRSRFHRLLDRGISFQIREALAGIGGSINDSEDSRSLVSRSGNHDRAIPENESDQDVIPKQSPAFAAYEKDRLTGQIPHTETRNVVILMAKGLPCTTLSRGC